MYAIGFGVILEVVAAVATYVFAGPIAASFSTGEGGERIKDDLEILIKIFVVMYPFVAFGMFSSSMFQGVGKGMNALAVTILRSLVFTVIFAVAFVGMGWGLEGIWWGMNLGNIGGAIVAFTWARYHIATLETWGTGELEPDAKAE
jgi:Na+-driven multidrug efflux pump